MVHVKGLIPVTSSCHGLRLTILPFLTSTAASCQISSRNVCSGSRAGGTAGDAAGAIVAAGAAVVGALFSSILSSPKVDEQSIAGKREEMLQDLHTNGWHLQRTHSWMVRIRRLLIHRERNSKTTWQCSNLAVRLSPFVLRRISVRLLVSTCHRARSLPMLYP